LTGFAPDDLRTVTDAILSDLVSGNGEFDAQLDGATVLTGDEQSHMRDVRGVFASFYAAAAVALAILGIAFWRAGRPGSRWTRRDAWRGVRFGAIGLAIGTAAAGVIALIAFDAAFEVFHRLFFAQGTYRFDPATSRLVQLFPDAFWSETAIAVGAMILVVASGTAWLAGRRLRGHPVSEAADVTAGEHRAAAQGAAR
jgi:integral membrane protein (TIGR01906 family)